MADDKKTDDYAIEMDNAKNKDWVSESPPLPRSANVPAASAITNNPILPVLSYCGSSILMTVTNKYVLSGLDFNLNFFLLCVQVCFPRTNHQDLRLTVVVGRLRDCDSNMQIDGGHHLPRL